MKTCTTRQVLNRKLYKATEFTWKLYTVSDFAEIFAFKKSFFVSFYSVKVTDFSVLCFSRILEFEINYFIVSEVDWKKYHVTDFEMKISLSVSFEVNNLQRVRFWSLKTTSRPTLNWKTNNASDLGLKGHTTRQILNWM